MISEQEVKLNEVKELKEKIKKMKMKVEDKNMEISELKSQVVFYISV